MENVINHLPVVADILDFRSTQKINFLLVIIQ